MKNGLALEFQVPLDPKTHGKMKVLNPPYMGCNP